MPDQDTKIHPAVARYQPDASPLRVDRHQTSDLQNAYQTQNQTQTLTQANTAAASSAIILSDARHVVLVTHSPESGLKANS